MEPALLKPWHVKVVGMPKFVEICFRSFLATESVRGTELETLDTTNKGSFNETGHNGCQSFNRTQM